MAHYTYEITTDYPCPRCGNTIGIVEVYHFGATHKPACKGCGLSPQHSDHADTVKTYLQKAYFDYAETHSINMLQI